MGGGDNNDLTNKGMNELTNERMNIERMNIERMK